MLQSYTEAERQDWFKVKVRGRNRFIWRKGVLPTFLTCLIVALGLELSGILRFHSPLHLIILPIVLLGGYLEGSWKWKDFEKKYPE